MYEGGGGEGGVVVAHETHNHYLDQPRGCTLDGRLRLLRMSFIDLAHSSSVDTTTTTSSIHTQTRNADPCVINVNVM